MVDGAALLNRLGACEQCDAELCTIGDEVCCSQCGLPHPDHPLGLKNAAPPPAAAPKAAKGKAA